MARGINKVIIIGNLGADPEVRRNPNEGANGPIIATNVRVATSESWKDKQTGENRDRTEWHRIVFYGRLAEIAGDYLKSGSRVYVEGSLRTRKWQDQNGNERYTTEIVGGSMQMLDTRGQSGGDSDGDDNTSGYNQTNQNKSSSSYSSSQSSKRAPSAPSMADSEFEDDIPF